MADFLANVLLVPVKPTRKIPIEKEEEEEEVNRPPGPSLKILDFGNGAAHSSFS
jgi:hypothetical protein